MTPAARIQAAIEILGSLDETAKPADRFVRDWFRQRRYAGSKDRAAVGERVFSILRRRGSFSWAAQSESPRALALAALLHDGLSLEEIEALFSGGGYGPQPLTDAERAALAGPVRADAPAWVQGEYPEFLEPELKRAFGDDVIAEMVAFTARAPIDLRVNTLKSSRDDVLAALIADGLNAAPTPFAPHGIRVASGAGSAGLSRHPLYEAGAFEFQDEAAQICSLLCAASAGEHVLDLAAGAGGKSLALAADMKNDGEIVACDIRAPALKELEMRARRAGVSIIRAQEGAPPSELFDAVLVDAPCSGSGTWRRQPELKWRLTDAWLQELCHLQDTLLDEAAARTKPGGRLIFATCSILPRENADRIESFLARHAGFAVRPADEIWKTLGLPATPPSIGRYFQATPRQTATDGFFTAILERAP